MPNNQKGQQLWKRKRPIQKHTKRSMSRNGNAEQSERATIMKKKKTNTEAHKTLQRLELRTTKKHKTKDAEQSGRQIAMDHYKSKSHCQGWRITDVQSHVPSVSEEGNLILIWSTIIHVCETAVSVTETKPLPLSTLQCEMHSHSTLPLFFLPIKTVEKNKVIRLCIYLHSLSQTLHPPWF